MILYNKTNEELKEIIRTSKLRRGETAEDIISFADEQAEHGIDAVRSMLIFQMLENIIEDTFDVGRITVSRIGGVHRDSRARYTMYRDGNPDYRVGGRDTLYATEEEIRAIAEDYDRIYTKKSEDATVVFPTGELLFANHFNPMDEMPNDIKYSDKYSINGPLGRENTMQWLADNRGIAYGQLGNTSCAVYKVNNDKIYITSSYYGEEDGEETPPGELMGNISCGVWRFEAVDTANIAKHKFDIKEAEIEDLVAVTVTPGEWEIKVYYQHHADEELTEKFGFPLWAELNRVK